MDLYFMPGSPYARVTRIVAREVGAPCAFIQEPGYPPTLAKALNPAMQVPLLVDGARRVFGTALIADYLMSGRTARAAEPSPPFAETPTRTDQHWRDAQLLVALEQLLGALVLRSYLTWTAVSHGPDPDLPLDLSARERDRIDRLMDWLETEATPDGFLPGVLSLQDVWLICAIGWTEARIPIAWRARPALAAIVDRHATRPTIVDTAPTPIPGLSTTFQSG